MDDRRRHQRIRRNVPPRVYLGQMPVSARPLEFGGALARQYEVFASPTIDLSVRVVSRIGSRYRARFSPAPVSACRKQQAIGRGLAAGEAAQRSINEVPGGRVMRIAGR